MTSDLNRYLADALVEDRLREAERFRRLRVDWSEMPDPYEAVTVRLARPADAEAVARLSQLEGKHPPMGPTLVAEVSEAVVAARSLDNGASVADPFRPSAQLSELLALRSAHLRSAANGRASHRRRGLRAWLRGRVRRYASL
jgi:hypothetical protein